MNIRIISPAGSCADEVIDKGAETLRSWGHSVSFAKHAKGKYGRFAGTAEDRANDIVEALKNPDVDILYASRGGYGCMQLLDKIPLELIKEAKKPVFGYSDITALHALWQKANVRSVHAQMMKHLGEKPENLTSLAIKEILDALEVDKNALDKDKSILDRDKSILNRDNNALNSIHFNQRFGTIVGAELKFPMIGGNLAVLSGLHGTDYDFDYEGKYLFIEDIKESPYKIDRMMNQLRLGGVFGKIKALFIGQFTGCDEDPEMPKPLFDTMREMVEPYGIPMYFDVPIGHFENNYPIVEGA